MTNANAIEIRNSESEIFFIGSIVSVLFISDALIPKGTNLR